MFICFFVKTDRYLLPPPSYWPASSRKKKQEKKSFSKYTSRFFNDIGFKWR